MKKITIDSKTILKAIQSVGALIKSPNTMPILDTVLFEISENNLVLTADNLEVRSSLEVDIMSDEAFSYCVNYDLLVKVLKGLPNTPIDLVFSEKELLLSYLNGEYKIPVVPSAEFPDNNSGKMSSSITVNSLEFCEAIKNASIFCETGNNLTSLSSVLVWIRESDTRIVGGNGHVFFESKISAVGEDNELLLSKSVISYLIASLTTDEEVVINFNSNHVFISCQTKSISAVLGNLKYPKYEKLFHSTLTDKTYRVDKYSFVPVLKRILNVVDKNYSMIKMDFQGSKLEISYDNSSLQFTAKETIDSDYEGDSITIGFNSGYINNVISNCDGDITMSLSKPEKPCVIDAENIRCILAPLKLQNN